MEMKPLLFAALLFPITQQAVSSESVTNNGSPSCPSIGVAERTPHASGHTYATTGRFTMGEDGIPLFDYGPEYNNLGKWSNPYFNSNYANALYRDWLDTKCTDDKLKTQFLNVADWYVEKAEHKGDMALWTYPFYNNFFDLQPGWISGIGQARIAGVLYRAEAIAPGGMYRTVAEQAMNTYLHDIKEGGVVTFDNGVTWIEEAPDPGGRSYKILNGHMTGLSAIADIYMITKDPRWKDLIDRGGKAVSRDISKFDGGFVSYYSLDWPSPARRMAERDGYNSLHVEQLLWMYDYFKDATYLKWASHFQSYEMDNDKYDATYSINAKTNGPERSKSLGYGASWTTSKFPTSFTITPEKPTRFQGVAIDALDLARRPIDFTVTAFKDGRIAAQKDVTGNDKLWTDTMFKWPVVADKIQIDFTKGERLIAITSLMPIRKDIELTALPNQCNYRRAPGKDILYTYNFATDGNPETKMSVRCDGWIFLPMEKGKPYLRAVGRGVKGEQFTIRESWDMKNWKEVAVIPIDSGDRVRVNAKYAMIEFKRAAHEINSITTSAN